MLASLNHPHIAAIHGLEDLRRSVRSVGPSGPTGVALYLVEELVDGTTLREVLTAGGLSTRKAVEYARAISNWRPRMRRGTFTAT